VNVNLWSNAAFSAVCMQLAFVFVHVDVMEDVIVCLHIILQVFLHFCEGKWQ